MKIPSLKKNISVDDLPGDKYQHQMVASANKEILYAIGGSSGTQKEIYKFTCSEDIKTCEWKKTTVELKYGRYDFVAMSIPTSLATKLCK